VHHVNGDKSDNHPDNITVFSLQKAHMMWHHFLWRKPDYGDKTFRHSSSGYLASLGAAVIAARKSSKPRLKRLLGA
jgi:hypothetical protein